MPTAHVSTSSTYNDYPCGLPLFLLSQQQGNLFGFSQYIFATDGHPFLPPFVLCIFLDITTFLTITICTTTITTPHYSSPFTNTTTTRHHHSTAHHNHFTTHHHPHHHRSTPPTLTGLPTVPASTTPTSTALASWTQPPWSRLPQCGSRCPSPPPTPLPR